jgi:FtsH-binding integral membrane protein
MFPLFFIAMWLAVTTLLGFFSGWFRVAARFPDQLDEPILKLRGQSGSMGLVGVSMSGILILSACQFGLRVGLFRLFGPFERDFYVPWEEFSVVRSTRLFWPMAELSFGHPPVGTLRIRASIADRLAAAAAGRWPEKGPFVPETRSDTARRVFGQWALMTGFAAAFFTLAPLALAPRGSGPPIVVAIFFPAIVFGVTSLWRYFTERGPA